MSLCFAMILPQHAKWSLLMGLVSQNKAMNDLHSYMTLFHKIIRLSWDEWMSIPIKSRQKLCNRSRASCIHNFMVDHAARLLPDFHISDHYKLKVFSRGEYAIRFKKLDEELKTRNQQSGQVKKFKGQQPLEGLFTTYNLEVGYQLDSFEQDVRSCHLVCPNGDRIFWGIELFADDVVAYGVPPLFNDDIDDEVETAPAQFKQKKKGEVVPFNKVSGNDDDRSDQ